MKCSEKEDDKIEIGEYVRTDIGNILKYEGKEKEFIDEHLSISNKKDIEFLGRIVKHSKNIIDLIDARRLCKWCASKINSNKRDV